MAPNWSHKTLTACDLEGRTGGRATGNLGGAGPVSREAFLGGVQREPDQLHDLSRHHVVPVAGGVGCLHELCQGPGGLLLDDVTAVLEEDQIGYVCLSHQEPPLAEGSVVTGGALVEALVEPDLKCLYVPSLPSPATCTVEKLEDEHLRCIIREHVQEWIDVISEFESGGHGNANVPQAHEEGRDVRILPKTQPHAVVAINLL